MKLLKWLRTAQGFSLIEMMIAIGIGGLLTILGKDYVMSALRLQQLARDRNSLQNLEQDLRRAALDSSMWAISSSKDKTLENCVKTDSINCQPGSHPLRLYLTDTRLATGNFSGPGKACSGKACPILITANFTGICKAPGACDAAAFVQVDYEISVDGALYRKGLFRLVNTEAQFSDNAVSCGFDASGRIMLANQIEPSKVNCVDAPAISRTVSGVKPGNCKPNEELLTGFAADGTPICQAIKRAL